MLLPAPPAIASSDVSPACASSIRRAAGSLRVGRIQAALVGQDHQHVRLDQVGDQRAQRVVVAELDFVGDDGVVLVDDRDHAQAQQRRQGRARVQVAFAVGQVGMREQHLGRLDVVGAEARLVDLREAHLADGGAGLQFVDVGRTRAEAQAQHALGDGAGRHQHDFLAERAQARNLRGPARDGVVVEAAAFVGDERRTDLDDDAVGLLEGRLQG
jgi:hypothetical protein